jgi:fluoride exporter
VERLLLVCLAGGLGSGLRYVVIGWAARTFGGAWPYGVLIVNVVGSFALGLVAMVAASKLGPAMRAVLGAGFLGGLTTYSAFNQDTLGLLERKMYGQAAAYVVVMIAACLAAGACGIALARRV